MAGTGDVRRDVIDAAREGIIRNAESGDITQPQQGFTTGAWGFLVQHEGRYVRVLVQYVDRPDT